MNTKVITILTAIAVAMAAAPAASAAAHHGKAMHAKAAGCKGEFMYMKGGKCMDARNKA